MTSWKIEKEMERKHLAGLQAAGCEKGTMAGTNSYQVLLLSMLNL
jgi:hypothetical protein